LCTFGILFFGTPHNGSSKAPSRQSPEACLPHYSQKILETDSSLLNALEEGSEVLQNITDQFATLMPRFRVFFFWKQKRTTLPYSKVYIVNETSAALTIDGTERSSIAASHRGICKFEAGTRLVSGLWSQHCGDIAGSSGNDQGQISSSKCHVKLSEMA
jgi:hypothetical protein